jgi:flavorubredoxin
VKLSPAICGRLQWVKSHVLHFNSELLLYDTADFPFLLFHRDANGSHLNTLSE